MENAKVLKLGLPKGSLQESTFKMFKKAGFNVGLPNERSYFPSINDAEIKVVLLRAQEMARYVQDGALDCGITGNDWILENKADVVRVTDLIYAKQSLNKVRWVLAVPQGSGIKNIKQLRGSAWPVNWLMLLRITSARIKSRWTWSLAGAQLRLR